MSEDRHDEADKREASAERCHAKVNFAKAAGPNIHLSQNTGRRILRRTVLRELCCFRHRTAVVIWPLCLHGNNIEPEPLKTADA